MMNDEIKNKLEVLKKYDEKFLKLSEKILDAYGGAFFLIDEIVIGIIKRSLSLLDGFCTMIENNNNLCAASLVRLHLDSLLRFHALHLVENPHELSMRILKGERLDKIKDRNNKQLKDRYLAEEVNKKYDWVLRVYEETSGFVHLTKKHFSYAIAEVHKEDRSISWAIGAKEKHITEETILEYIEGFQAISNAILDYLLGWYISKDHPEILRGDKV